MQTDSSFKSQYHLISLQLLSVLTTIYFFNILLCQILRYKASWFIFHLLDQSFESPSFISTPSSIPNFKKNEWPLGFTPQLVLSWLCVFPQDEFSFLCQPSAIMNSNPRELLIYRTSLFQIQHVPKLNSSSFTSKLATSSGIYYLDLLYH